MESTSKNSMTPGSTGNGGGIFRYDNVECKEALNEIGRHWVADVPGNEAAWEQQMILTMLYVSVEVVNLWGGYLLNSVRHDCAAAEYVREKVEKRLQSDVRRYDPERSSLHKYISDQISRRIYDVSKEYEEHRGSKLGQSLDTLINPGDPEDGQTFGSTLRAEDGAYADDLEKAESFNSAFLSMMSVILNFKEKQGTKRGTPSRLVHYRLAYTEQIACLANSSTPMGLRQMEANEQSQIRAMNQKYLQAFAEGIPEEGLTIRDMAGMNLKTKKAYFYPEQQDNEEVLSWKQDAYFEVKVPMHYLKVMEAKGESPDLLITAEQKVSSTNEAFSRFRKEYQEDLREALKEQMA